jgi:hypothetical protein
VYTFSNFLFSGFSAYLIIKESIQHYVMYVGACLCGCVYPFRCEVSLKATDSL